jgi:hypothetical protein
MKRKPDMKKIAIYSGWIGMCLLHGSTIPPLMDQLLNPGTANLPPLSMVLLVWVGLIMYLARAIAQKDWLYITSNGIGMFFNSLLMALIIFA